MAKTSNINVRISPDTKSRAEELFKHFGLTISDAVTIFLNQSIMYGGIPFEIRLPNPETLEVLDEIRDHKNLSGPFDSVEALMEDLNS